MKGHHHGIAIAVLVAVALVGYFWAPLFPKTGGIV